jgi:hypothetical protein
MTAITIRQVSDLATFLLPPYFEPFTRVFGALAPTGQTQSVSFIAQNRVIRGRISHHV